MERCLALAIAIVVMVGCSEGNAGKTFVYELERPPIGQLDPNACAQDAGLELDLGFQESIGFSVDVSGQEAFLSTCDLENGQVLTCGLLIPQTSLVLDGDTVTGESVARLEIDGDCEGADITLTYDMLITGNTMRTVAVATWQLDNTLACEQLETAIRAGSPSGLGVSGCAVTYDFVGTKLAECNFNRAEPCAYPE